MSSDYNLIRKMQRAADRVHEEIRQEQISHPVSEYTEERVASLMAKVEAARQYWDWHEFKVNV